MTSFSRLLIASASVAALSWEALAIRSDSRLEDNLESESESQSLWNIYDKDTGPKLQDIAQGELGDCYYLAGLAAIALFHPELIEQAFLTKGHLNPKGRSVYELQFLLDGEVRKVAVDDVFPMFNQPGYLPQFFFATFNKGDNAWVSLLEKGFAKMMGSYMVIRGGIGYETFKAITQPLWTF